MRGREETWKILFGHVKSKVIFKHRSGGVNEAVGNMSLEERSGHRSGTLKMWLFILALPHRCYLKQVTLFPRK